MNNMRSFIHHVRMELNKIALHTRKSTGRHAIAVVVMVVICALFLFVADQVLSFVLRLILNLGA